jgi:hypothetical protein
VLYVYSCNCIGYWKQENIQELCGETRYRVDKGGEEEEEGGEEDEEKSGSEGKILNGTIFFNFLSSCLTLALSVLRCSGLWLQARIHFHYIESLKDRPAFSAPNC